MPEWKLPADSMFALTSISTAPEWCSTLLYTWHPLAVLPSVSIFVRAQQGQKSFANKYSDCYPPSFATIAALQELPIDQSFTKFWDVVTAHTTPGRGIYSPGVCPSGWTSSSTSRPGPVPANDPAGWYICCPIGFSWKDLEDCRSVPTTATIVALNDESKTRTIHPPYTLIEWPMLIAYASSDLDDFHPASAPLLLHKINEESNSNSSTRLSTGAKAGIGIGVTVACVALIGLLITMLLLRRKRRTRESVDGVDEIEAKKATDTSKSDSQKALDIGPESGSSVDTTGIAKATNTINSTGANYAIDNTAGLHRRTTM